jgi:hypothetical protein
MQPVFLIGTARSGTTLLGEYILSKSLNVSYLGEINYVWRYSKQKFNLDDISCEDYSDNSVSSINKQIIKIAKYKNKDAKVFIDKTPSNCLRIELLLRTFPNAKFIILNRNGNDVIKSSMVEWQGKAGKALDNAAQRKLSDIGRMNRIFRDKLQLKNRIFDLYSSYEMLFQLNKCTNIFKRLILSNSKPNVTWGPRYIGIDESFENYSLEEVCSEQWIKCQDSVVENRCSIDDDKVLDITYENLIDNPRSVIARIFDFLNIDEDEHIIEEISNNVVKRDYKAPKELSSPNRFKDRVREINKINGY